MNQPLTPQNHSVPSNGNGMTPPSIPEISTSQTPLMGNTLMEPVAVKQSDFLSKDNPAEKDTLYQDLFRKNDDGEIITGKKPRKSGLEIFTRVMTYVTGFVIFFTFAGGVHVFIKNQDDNNIATHLPFLCGYMNYDIHAKENKECKTAKMLETEYQERQKQLEHNIVNQLATYIPLRISSDIFSSSKEHTFIFDTYHSKINTRDIINKFEDVRKKSESAFINNIDC